MRERFGRPLSVFNQIAENQRKHDAEYVSRFGQEAFAEKIEREKIRAFSFPENSDRSGTITREIVQKVATDKKTGQPRYGMYDWVYDSALILHNYFPQEELFEAFDKYKVEYKELEVKRVAECTDEYIDSKKDRGIIYHRQFYILTYKG